MESSVTAERGAYSVENMYGLIRFEAEALGLSSQQRINGLIIFHPENFAEVVGIQSLSESSLLLYSDIETDGGDSPYTVDLWPLEALTQVSHFKTHICPESYAKKKPFFGGSGAPNWQFLGAERALNDPLGCEIQCSIMFTQHSTHLGLLRLLKAK